MSLHAVTSQVEAPTRELAAVAERRPSTLGERFRHWRKTRPFWGSVLLFLGGLFIVKPLLSSYRSVVAMGSSGMIVYVIGLGIMLAALVALLSPAQRVFPGLMGVILAVASLPLANLGGWIVGMLLGVIGGAMVVAWTPYSERQIAQINQWTAHDPGLLGRLPGLAFLGARRSRQGGAASMTANPTQTRPRTRDPQVGRQRLPSATRDAQGGRQRLPSATRDAQTRSASKAPAPQPPQPLPRRTMPRPQPSQRVPAPRAQAPAPRSRRPTAPRSAGVGTAPSVRSGAPAAKERPASGPLHSRVEDEDWMRAPHRPRGSHPEGTTHPQDRP